MRNKKTVLLGLVFLVLIIVGRWYMNRSRLGLLIPSNILAMERECGRDEGAHRSTDFLTIDQTIELVGRYDEDLQAIDDYDPKPCLKWQGEVSCGMRYYVLREEEKEYTWESDYEMVDANCSDLIKRRFSDPGVYKVSKACCLYGDNCQELEWDGRDDEEYCTIFIDPAKEMKACFNKPIKLVEKPEGVLSGDYIKVWGKLSPSRFDNPFVYAEQSKKHFILDWDGFESLEDDNYSSQQAVKACRASIRKVNRHSLWSRVYCAWFGYDCDFDVSLYGFGDKELTEEQAMYYTSKDSSGDWVVQLPLGSKLFKEIDIVRELSVFCRIDSESGSVRSRSMCYESGCHDCE